MKKSYGENEVGISAKRCPSPLPSALRTAFPLRPSTRESSTRSEYASGTDSPKEPGTTTPTRDCFLSQYLEPDSQSEVYFPSDNTTNSLPCTTNLDHKHPSSRRAFHGCSYRTIHHADLPILPERDVSGIRRQGEQLRMG